MIGDKRFLGFIPARGGSKGIPRKNLVNLAGQPLLAYSIGQALQIPEIDKVVVSTDDREIADVAAAKGSGVIMRPAELATDQATTESAMLHALDVLGREGDEYDYTVIIEPTSPLRSPATVQRCLRLAIDRSASVVITVTEIKSNLGRLRNDRFTPLIPNAPRRRQDREPTFAEVGVAYVVSTTHLRKSGRIFDGPDPMAIAVDPIEAIDINTPADLILCSALLGVDAGLGAG